MVHYSAIGNCNTRPLGIPQQSLECPDWAGIPKIFQLERLLSHNRIAHRNQWICLSNSKRESWPPVQITQTVRTNTRTLRMQRR